MNWVEVYAPRRIEINLPTCHSYFPCCLQSEKWVEERQIAASYAFDLIVDEGSELVG